MKIGNYVRTPLGITKYIGKYDNYEGFYEFDKLDEELWTGDIANVVYTCEIDNIVLKSSPNIIDLIEVGDYVNGMIVHCVYADRDEIVVGSFDILIQDTLVTLRSNNIKSIVTKEQFEAIKYEIK